MRKDHTKLSDDFDERGLLKDGHTYRPSGGLMMMDNAMSRRSGFAGVKTADGNDLSFHKPGWRLAATHDADPPEFSYGVTAADRQAIIDAREQYEHKLTTAWQHGAQKENVVPDAPKASGSDATPVDDIETAYRLYSEEISQAWKTPR